jgi:hypothetical protein
LALLSWRADSLGDRVIQIYVNGSLFDVVVDPDQTELWCHLDRVHDVEIEMHAVEPEVAWTVESTGYRGRASLAIARDESLPIDARVYVSVDGVSNAGQPLWGPTDSRGGLGAIFGIGPFGLDNLTDTGDSNWIWTDDDLSAGEHLLDAQIRDHTGRRIAQLAEPLSITLERFPRAAVHPRIESDLTLRWD